MAAIRALRTIRDRRLSRLPLYEDITPSTSWTDDTNGRNLIIDIPGFKKEEVNMEIDEAGNVSIKGKRHVGTNRFKRFSITVKVPENTDMKGIVGNLVNGLYTVVFPKMDVPEAVQDAELVGGGGEAVESKPEQKLLDADELDEKTKKGLEAELGAEASKTMERAEDVSSMNASTDKAQVTEKELETATSEADIVNASKILKKTVETDIPEKAATTTNEIAALEPEIKTMPLETAADHKQTIPKSPDIASQEPENVTKAKETASRASATATKKAITTTDTAPETKSLSDVPKATAPSAPETKSLSEVPKATAPSAPETKSLSEVPIATEPSALDTVTTVLKKEMVEYATKVEPQENQVVKKDRGFMENVVEIITEHKVCIISVILAFSMGILISRRISSK